MYLSYLSKATKIWHETFVHKIKMIQGVYDIHPNRIFSGDICPGKNILDQIFPTLYAEIWHATCAHKNKISHEVCDIYQDNICSVYSALM